jgi:D-threo-aldose 1-dehydrogenase
VPIPPEELKLEGTLKRLGTDYVDMVSIHDPDEAIHFGPGEDPYARSRFREAMDGAYAALDELRSQGVIKAVGVGINQWQMLSDFVVAGEFDYFLLAGRYTLLEQEPLATLLPLCEQRGTRIIIGGPYNSGILATGALQGRDLQHPAGARTGAGAGASDRGDLRPP